MLASILTRSDGWFRGFREIAFVKLEDSRLIFDGAGFVVPPTVLSIADE
jgi:hypothetical protein